MISPTRQLRRKFKADVDIAAVYDALADQESDSELRRHYQMKAWRDRERAAGIWIQLWTAGAHLPTWEQRLRGKWLSLLARKFSGFERRATN